MINTKTNMAKQGSNIAYIIANLSQYMCMKIAQINPALSIINNKIKPQRRNPWNPYQSTQYENALNTKRSAQT